eukprot:1798257-Prorocentrum_lima.AAC.1
MRRLPRELGRREYNRAVDSLPHDLPVFYCGDCSRFNKAGVLRCVHCGRFHYQYSREHDPTGRRAIVRQKEADNYARLRSTTIERET